MVTLMNHFDTERSGGGAAVPVDQRRFHLERLGRAVETMAGFNARVLNGSRNGPTRLHVSDPAAPEMSDDVSCDLVDGEWRFVWSWGEVIGRPDDLFGVATAIQHVIAGRT
jgi:hypothetical protein